MTEVTYPSSEVLNLNERASNKKTAIDVNLTFKERVVKATRRDLIYFTTGCSIFVLSLIQLISSFSQVLAGVIAALTGGLLAGLLRRKKEVKNINISSN